MVNDYRCNCKPGYEGRNCEIDIDDCELEQQPCQNGATCLDKVDGYFCECRPGYSGELCELDVDECLENPCENSGTCINQVPSFSCLCPPGYKGQTCQNKLNKGSRQSRLILAYKVMSSEG